MNPFQFSIRTVCEIMAVVGMFCAIVASEYENSIRLSEARAESFQHGIALGSASKESAIEWTIGFKTYGERNRAEIERRRALLESGETYEAKYPFYETPEGIRALDSRIIKAYGEEIVGDFKEFDHSTK